MTKPETRAEELAKGHEDRKVYANTAYKNFRGKGIQRFQDNAGREFWLSEQKMQVVLPDGSEVHYTVDSNSLAIRGPSEQQFCGYTDYVGDFQPFVSAIDAAQTIALSEDPTKYGAIVSGVTGGKDAATDAFRQTLS